MRSFWRTQKWNPTKASLGKQALDHGLGFFASCFLVDGFVTSQSWLRGLARQASFLFLSYAFRKRRFVPCLTQVGCGSSKDNYTQAHTHTYTSHIHTCHMHTQNHTHILTHTHTYTLHHTHSHTSVMQELRAGLEVKNTYCCPRSPVFGF